MRISVTTIIVAAGALAACATIIEGTAQSVTIATSPPGATCTVIREGQTLGEIAATPDSIRVDKSKNDLSVTCQKPGYQTASITQSPKFVGTTFGNVILGGGVGAIIDASTGANYEYPSQITLTMAPTPVAPSASPVLPSTAPAPRP